ncbi:MAG: hypothetical protein ABI165_01215 [Bryobacteraceae bacterium]
MLRKHSLLRIEDLLKDPKLSGMLDLEPGGYAFLEDARKYTAKGLDRLSTDIERHAASLRAEALRDWDKPFIDFRKPLSSTPPPKTK